MEDYENSNFQNKKHQNIVPFHGITCANSARHWENLIMFCFEYWAPILGCDSAVSVQSKENCPFNTTPIFIIFLVNSLTFLLHSCNVQKLFINLLFWCRLLLPYPGQGSSLGCLCSQGSQNREYVEVWSIAY